jgi:hypothetical protein
MKKTVHFISGLPHSGSSMLCNILAQNTRFQTMATSGIMNIIFYVRNNWNKLVEFTARLMMLPITGNLESVKVASATIKTTDLT